LPPVSIETTSNQQIQLRLLRLVGWLLLGRTPRKKRFKGVNDHEDDKTAYKQHVNQQR